MKKITSFWSKSVVHEGFYFYIVYWHPNLKHPILVKANETPLSGEKLW